MSSNRTSIIITLVSAALACSRLMTAQENLQQEILGIAADARGTVSVASLPGRTLNCDLNPLAHPPMQSVISRIAETVAHSSRCSMVMEPCDE